MEYKKTITSSNNTNSKAMTLIELLVTVAVIALLASILLPSLQRAKDIARRAVCGSNLRGLVMANHTYATDNRGFFMLAAEDIWRPNHKRWHGYRTSSSEPFDPKRSPFMDYMGTEGLKACPSFEEGLHYCDDNNEAQAFEAGCGGYGYNAVYIGGRNDIYGISEKATSRSAALVDITTPSETVMFTDTAFMESATTKIAYSFCEPPFWEMSNGSYTMRPDPTIDFRHLGKTNVGWSDGHVSSEEMTHTVDYQTHSKIGADQAASLGLGWFGPESNDLFDLK